MKILSHRGYWLDSIEKNSDAAFRRSFDFGFGTETDVRDSNGTLVISHDLPQGGEMPFTKFLALHAEYAGNLPLALNVKADGLQAALLKAFAEYPSLNYFVFDMSVPDLVQYAQTGIRFFTRLSEYEPYPALQEKAEGVWLDAFETEWYGKDVLQDYLSRGKVCLVSPELHRRPHLPLWQKLQEYEVFSNPHFMLCTDYPELAKEFFHGAN